MVVPANIGHSAISTIGAPPARIRAICLRFTAV